MGWRVLLSLLPEQLKERWVKQPSSPKPCCGGVLSCFAWGEKSPELCPGPPYPAFGEYRPHPGQRPTLTQYNIWVWFLPVSPAITFMVANVPSCRRGKRLWINKAVKSKWRSCLEMNHPVDGVGGRFHMKKNMPATRKQDTTFESKLIYTYIIVQFVPCGLFEREGVWIDTGVGHQIFNLFASSGMGC